MQDHLTRAVPSEASKTARPDLRPLVRAAVAYRLGGTEDELRAATAATLDAIDAYAREHAIAAVAAERARRVQTCEELAADERPMLKSEGCKPHWVDELQRWVFVFPRPAKGE